MNEQRTSNSLISELRHEAEQCYTASRDVKLPDSVRVQFAGLGQKFDRSVYRIERLQCLVDTLSAELAKWVSEAQREKDRRNAVEPSAPASNPLGKRAYVMSESDSPNRRYRLIIGFETLDDLQEAHSFLVRGAAVEPPAALCVDPASENARCPFTKRPYFMHLDHPEFGRIATYGGPFDSYTIPQPDEDGNLRCEQYDHDAGNWVEGGAPTSLTVISERELSRLSEPPDGVLRGALQQIAMGPPTGMDNSEVAAWAVWIASQALAIKPTSTKNEPYVMKQSEEAVFAKIVKSHALHPGKLVDEKPDRGCPPCQLELGGERCADCGYQQADEKTGCSCTADEEAVCLVEPCPRSVTKHSTAVETFESLSKEKQ